MFKSARMSDVPRFRKNASESDSFDIFQENYVPANLREEFQWNASLEFTWRKNRKDVQLIGECKSRGFLISCPSPSKCDLTCSGTGSENRVEIEFGQRMVGLLREIESAPDLPTPR